MKIAYLVNQYPKVSHSFIRREIAALESLGAEVIRFSIRRPDGGLPEPADRPEAGKTSVLLDAGVSGLLGALLRWAITHPAAFVRAAFLAFRVGRHSDRGLLRHAVYLGEACLLRSRLLPHRPDRLHAHFGTNPTTVAMLCHALGGPAFSFTAHGPEEFDRASGIGLAEKVARAHEVFGISEFARSQLYRTCPGSMWDKLHVVRCGLDDSFLGRPPTPVPDTRRLLCVGRLCEQKGQLLLIEALARITAEGLDCELVLAGDGEMRPEVEALVARHGLSDRVQITGWVSGAEVARLLGECRAMVLPSFAEGLPVVIMEALALGRPVVTTWVAGIPELVEHGRCGWLVPPGALEPLVASLRELLDTPTTELTARGAEGRRRVLAQHDVHAIACEMLTIWSGRRPTTNRSAPSSPDASTQDAPAETSHPIGAARD